MTDSYGGKATVPKTVNFVTLQKKGSLNICR